MTAQHSLKWGISTLGCHELDLEAICRLAAQFDIRFLEIRCLADRQDLPAYLDETFKNPGAIQTVLDEYRQNVIALNSGFSLIGADKKARNDLLEFARWAEALNIPYIRIFGGGTMNTPLSETELQTAADALNWWQNIREKNEWTTDLAMETHDGFSSGERCLQLEQALGRSFVIIWDTHHTWKLGGESASQTWKQISHLIRHVHIKDSVSVPSARHPYTYVLPGTGEFPATNVLSILQKSRYCGVVSLEWERKWHPYMPPLDQALTALDTAGWRSLSIAQPA